MNQSVKFEHRELMVKELRVGNLIEGFWEEEDDDGEYVERYGVVEVLSLDVTRSLGDGWAIMVESKHKQEIEHYDGFYGVPLTEEWLEKFDFSFQQDYGLFGFFDKNHAVFKLEDGSFEFHPFCTNDRDCWIKIQYVHQLQNLSFALTGEELITKHKENDEDEVH